MIKRTLITIVLTLASVSSAAAQATIFIVRHAERADAGGVTVTDPNLSRVGHARATSLAETLKDVKLTAIYATEFKRTQQTAAPTAKAQGRKVTTIPADKTAALVDELKQAKGAVLVVGHSDSVTQVMAGLGIANPTTIANTEFDNLFVVMTGAEIRAIRLHYK